MSINTTAKAALNRKVNTHEHLKLVHSFSNQVKPLRDYLNQLLKMIPSYREPRKRQALLDHISNVVKSHGNSGLKQHRKLFIQGVKVLGGDQTTDFAGFSLDQDGFPRHYGDLFRLLKSYRKYSTVDVPVRVEKFDPDGRKYHVTLTETTRYVVAPISDIEARQISLVLSILRWPYSLKLDLSEATKTELLDNFGKEIEDAMAGTAISSLRVGERVAGEMLRYLPEDYKAPMEFKPQGRTYKGGRPDQVGSRLLPRSLTYATGIHNPGWSYNGPVGRATVISERAGKTRFITSYDGSINSSNLYEKVRAVLDRIPEDCSADQSKGHILCRNLTQSSVGKSEDSLSVIYSTDLDSFTDRLVLGAYRDFLTLINCDDFLGCITAPVIVNGKSVTPHRALMGLKGTFELASVVHHGIALMCGLRERALCGDDLLFASKDKGVLQRYETLCRYVGLKLNRLKTVVSTDTGTFCGKVYFRGMDVSPVVPPLYSFSSNMDDFISSAGNFIDNASRMGRGFIAAANALVLKFGRTFRGTYVPYFLPFKLGGIGVSKCKGLLRILKSRMARLHSRVPEPPEKLPSRTIRFPIEVSGEVPHVVDLDLESYFRWTKFGFYKHGPEFGFNNLLDSGFTMRYRGKPPVVKKTPLLKDLHSILCYYYGVAT